MSLKAKLEAIIYAAETPVTLDQLIELVQDSVREAGAENGTEVKSRVRMALEELIADHYSPEHGIEIRQVAGGYRMSTKPEQHDMVRAFAKSLKPPIRLSLPALETLAVIAYKQPVTVPEISEIRGVDSGGVISTLLDRKLITTGGRKAVVGRPILYKTTKEFLLRFGLKDVNELPSMEEFEKLVAESFQSEMLPLAAENPEGATNGDRAPNETALADSAVGPEKTEQSQEEQAKPEQIQLDQEESDSGSAPATEEALAPVEQNSSTEEDRSA
jgi:segregation and condensation protein B